MNGESPLGICQEAGLASDVQLLKHSNNSYFALRWNQWFDTQESGHEAASYGSD
jgi:hypothetical protein